MVLASPVHLAPTRMKRCRPAQFVQKVRHLSQNPTTANAMPGCNGISQAVTVAPQVLSVHQGHKNASFVIKEHLLIPEDHPVAALYGGHGAGVKRVLGLVCLFQKIFS